MDREQRFHELDDMVESWSVDEQNFVLWLLLRKYAERIDIPEHANTLDEYRIATCMHNTLVACNEVIDILNYELWR